MRKIITTIAASLLLIAAANAGTIEWQANWAAYVAGAGELTINGETVLDNWVVGLYQSTGTNPGEGFNILDLGANLLASTDVLIDLAGPVPSTWTHGLATTQPSLADNIPIYTVLFNTTDSGIFTTTPASYSYLIIDDAGSVAFDSGTAGPTTPDNYDVSTVAGNSWVAVPEPATAMLLALGGSLAWLVRMKNIGY